MNRFLRLLFMLLCAWAPVPASAAVGPAVWPLSPRPKVMRGFEPPPKPWLPGHRGVDLLGRVGQQVRAPVAGTILYAGQLAGRGVIVVSHGETRTTYEPVLATVQVGDRVPQGAPLGTLSAVPSHCAPRVCLHWGLLRGSTYLDPLTLLTSAPIRLFPLNDPQTPDAASWSADSAPPGAASQSADSAGSGGSVTGDQQESSVPGGAASGGSVMGSLPHDRQGSSVPGGVVVAIAGAVTIGGALLIRRH